MLFQEIINLSRIKKERFVEMFNFPAIKILQQFWVREIEYYHEN